jgi:putative transposase
VRQVFKASRGIYGSKKIAHELQKSTEVEKACRNTVAKAMKEMGLKSRIYRRFRPTTTVTEVITAAMRKAIQARRPSAGALLHHSDRDCQYTSESFQDLLRTLQITCSMSRTGCCYDNAVAERFFWSLKHEWTKFESYENLDDAKISVFKYIETF